MLLHSDPVATFFIHLAHYFCIDRIERDIERSQNQKHFFSFRGIWIFTILGNFLIFLSSAKTGK